ncbi:hypothetical protein EB72_01350 [Mycobacterium sp. SWH-M1]|nr:hypothetical protein EB72_01350 [Mycobacterium sp. SWH-M1]
MLHATFRGGKLANADVENLLLYNIDSFKIAGRNGIRFEHGEGAALTTAGNPYSFGYRYALATRSGSFDNWREVRTLASFDWVDLGLLTSEKRLAQVWFALARACAQGAISLGGPVAPDTPFAVRLQMRPPIGASPVWGGLVKGIFDGVICAFQAHTDKSCLEDVAHRLALQLPAHPGEIIELLSEQRCAVLGAVSRLVAPYRSGVKWNPRDHDCVAGELLSAESVDANWAIKGKLAEVARP